ncbi:MAG: hypothetical protein H6617_02970 [Bdellovibrionaceae bacterium]|nr:hypothetical protein [Pseudobdellovibrionaceae bacterium]
MGCWIPRWDAELKTADPNPPTTVFSSIVTTGFGAESTPPIAVHPEGFTRAGVDNSHAMPLLLDPLGRFNRGLDCVADRNSKMSAVSPELKSFTFTNFQSGFPRKGHRLPGREVADRGGELLS